jgi:hypothetical protein
MSVTVRATLALGLNLLGPVFAAGQTPPGLDARRKPWPISWRSSGSTPCAPIPYMPPS